MKVKAFFGIILSLVTVFVTVGNHVSAIAIDLNVDTTLDSNVAGYQACTAAPDDCSLRGAISKANANPSIYYRVVLPDGIYQLTIANPSGTPENDNASGDLDIRTSIHIQGNSFSTTFVQAGDSAATGIDRVFDVIQPVTGTNNVTIMGITIRHGKVPNGGSGAGVNVDYNSYVYLGYVAVRDNLGVGYSYGAGVLSLSNMDIDHAIFLNNVNENGEGGAIYHSQGTMTIQNSLFTSNSAQYGGAIANQFTMNINNTTITGNTASNGGGGITQWNSGNITMRNSTVALNTNTGSNLIWDIYNARTFNAYNSIIYAPAGKTACVATMSAGNNNLVRNGDTSCGSVSQVIQGEPMLGALQYNGSFIETMAIGRNSAALDAGDPATCLGTDQRGISRPIDGNFDGVAICDIGAYERQAITYLPVILK